MIPYHIGRTKRTHIVTFEDICPTCRQRVFMLLTKQEMFDTLVVIPMWKKQYFVTCNKCSSIIEMEKKVGEQLEESVRSNHKDSISGILVTAKNRYGSAISRAIRQETQQRSPVVKTGIHCYDVLGVAPSASQEEVRVAYVEKLFGGNESAHEVDAAYNAICELKGWSKTRKFIN